MKIVLDCENLHTTLNSISNIYGASRNDISSYLKGFNLEQYYLEKELDKKEEIKNTLIRLFSNEFRELETTPDLIYWFHGTRVLKEEKFKEGILPLGLAIGKIWKTLFKIFSDSPHKEKLSDLKTKGITDFHYQTRLPESSLWGPYARLVKEAAFQNEELWSHDYLKIPEIIEDICKSYSIEYGESIIEDVKNALVACIVKFRSINNVNKWQVYTALFYLYHELNNFPLIFGCDTSYDAKNEVIPKSDIVKIEFIVD